MGCRAGNAAAPALGRPCPTGRLGDPRRRSGRHEVLVARRDQPGQRGSTGSRLDVGDRGETALDGQFSHPGRTGRARQVPGNSGRPRRGHVRQHLLQPRRRAGRGHRGGTLGLRPPCLRVGEPPAGLPLLPPRRRRLDRRRGTARLHQQPLDAGRSRRADRRADPVVRQGRGRGPHREPDVGDEPAPVHEHLTAGGLQGPGHRRQRRSRQPDLPEKPSGRRAGVQRPHRRIRLELPHDSPGGRVWQRHLGGGLRLLYGIGQCLGALHRGRRTRTRVSADQHAEQRLLRRPSEGGQPLRGVHRMSRRQYRQAGLALPDRASRDLGL